MLVQMFLGLSIIGCCQEPLLAWCADIAFVQMLHNVMHEAKIVYAWEVSGTAKVCFNRRACILIEPAQFFGKVLSVSRHA